MFERVTHAQALGTRHANFGRWLTDRPRGLLLSIAGCLLIALTVSHWATLVDLRAFWSRNQDYSVGQLVPLVVAYLIWSRRSQLRRLPMSPSVIGLAVLTAAEMARLVGVYFGYGSAERYAFILAIVGITLVTAGRFVVWHLRWPLGFLLLMVPLPVRVHEAIALPLQDLSTRIAVFTLELFGYFVQREGHVVWLEETTSVSVTEACSGLRMVTAFIVVTAVVAFLVSRPRWQKPVLLASSIPIAVVVNAARIVVTAVVLNKSENPSASDQLHDLAGLAMMPAGLLLVLALLYAMRPWTPSPASRTVAAQRPKRPVSSSPHLHGRHYTVVVLATLLLACGAVGYRAAHAGVSRQMNVAITLDRPLETLPFGIGAWVGEDVELPAGVLRVARNDDQVARRYRHTTTGEVADLYVAYTGRPRTMLRHRPSVCYPAAGWSLLADRQVESAAGTPIRVHEFLKPGLTEHRVVVVNYYVAGGRLTTDEDSFWGPLWRTPTARRDGARYVVQVQVVVDATMGAETAERVAQRLVEDSLADILVLLPESAETSVTREGK